MKHGLTFWFTGLSGAGKTSLSVALHEALKVEGHFTVILDGDELRRTLSNDLSFSEIDRMEQNRRAANVAKLLNSQGINVLAALISPSHAIQSAIKSIIGSSFCHFIHVDCSLEECQKRDVKALYSNQTIQQAASFTGIHQLYEPPITPWLYLNTEILNIEKCTENLLVNVRATIEQ